jgi:hypothetical protein
VPRGKTVQSQREKSAVYKPRREVQENPHRLISQTFTLKLQNCTTINFCCVCHLSVVLCHSRWRNYDSVMGTPTVYWLPCVTQLPFLLKSPGQSNCLHDQVIVCSLWLGLGSACLWQPPKHHSINSDNLTQTPTLYLKFTFKFCFPMIQCLYIYTLYI